MDADWNVIVQVLTVLAGIATSSGLLLIPTVNWIKKKLNLKGFGVIVLASLVSAILAEATMILSGEIGPLSLQPEHLVMTTLAIYKVAQDYYNHIRRNMD